MTKKQIIELIKDIFGYGKLCKGCQSCNPCIRDEKNPCWDKKV